MTACRLCNAPSNVPECMLGERHDPGCEHERRAPVQGDLFAHHGTGTAAGTIAWSEHVAAWEVYASRYGKGQSAERIAERGGFGHGELRMFLGHDAETFRPHEAR